MKQTNLGATIAPIAGITTGQRVKNLSRRLLTRYAAWLTELLEENVTPHRAVLITSALLALTIAMACCIFMQWVFFALAMGAFAWLGKRAGIFPDIAEGGDQ